MQYLPGSFEWLNHKTSSGIFFSSEASDYHQDASSRERFRMKYKVYSHQNDNLQGQQCFLEYNIVQMVFAKIQELLKPAFCYLPHLYKAKRG